MKINKAAQLAGGDLATGAAQHAGMRAQPASKQATMLTQSMKAILIGAALLRSAARPLRWTAGCEFRVKLAFGAICKRAGSYGF
nr:hypothetical protein [Comamonas aquatica]